MNPSHRGEGCNKFKHAGGAQRLPVFATWPSGQRLVRFEPNHNESKHICSIDILYNLFLGMFKLLLLNSENVQLFLVQLKIS